MEEVLSDLSTAARIMNAPPSTFGLDQRKQAETFLLKFKKSDKPYAICKQILEETEDPYLHFLASCTLKEGVMREWAMLGDTEIDQLRDYLLNYAHQHLGRQAYILRQMLHVVALIVKRSLLAREPVYLQEFVTNVCSLFNSPDTLGLGLEIAGALLSEFTVADKTLSSYMSYQHNLDCKKNIEGDGLYKIFVSTLEVINRLRSSPVEQHKKEWSQVMNILYSVLSWDFGVILSKRLAQMSNLSMSVINLMPGNQWSVLKEETLLSLLVELYALFATDREVQHVVRLCIVQLGTLQGSVFESQEERVSFLSRYIAAMVTLIAGACKGAGSAEDHGLALAVRQLLWANTCQDVNNVHAALFKEFLAALTELSVKVLINSANNEEDRECTQDLVDVVLDIWLTLHQMIDTLPRSPLDHCMLRVVECYLNCHMAPPAGIRVDTTDLDEVDVDTEEDDRVKYREQLDIVGNLARVNMGHTLKHYTAFLLHRTRALASRIESQEECNPLFEDIHWLVMLVGYTLSDAHTDTDLTIPAPILLFLASNDPPIDMESYKLYIQSKIGKCGDLPNVNDVLSGFLVLLELAAVYQDILSKGGRHLLSPQVYSSLMWALTRITATYLMPNEQEYEFIPQSLLLSFGEESPIAQWVLGFLVEKVISGLVFYSGEQAATEDCMALIQTLSKNPRVSPILMSDLNFQNLIERYTTRVLVLSSSKANKMLAASLTTVMSHLPASEQGTFIDKVFGPIRDNTVHMLRSDNVGKIPNCPQLTQELLTALDTFHGLASGIISKIVDAVFVSVMPVLEGCVGLMKVSQHVQPITSSILQLFCAVSDSGVLQMDKSQTNRLYETCYKLLKCYSDSAPSKDAAVVGSQEDRYDNILLCLELLSHLCSKDFFVFDEADRHDDTSSRLVLVGLDIIVPHIDVELLKFPKLSSEFFKLITFICEVYPEKVAALPVAVVDQIVLMLKVGLNNYNDDITFYIFNAVSALAMHSPGNPFFQKKIGQIIKHTLLLISGQELSAELYDTAADMVFSFICKCRDEYMTVVNEIVVQQPDPASQECLRTAFSTLIPNTTNISRRDKGKFSKVFENFAVNVYGICRG